MSSAHNLQVSKGTEIGKPGMMRLYVDEPSDLPERAEHLKLGGVHGGVPGTEGEVWVDLLEPVEGWVEDSEATLNNGTVDKTVYIPSMNNVPLMDNITEGTGFRTRSITGYTFSIYSLK